ncbi:hypothetical protein SCHPADRAFT_85383 [Schizopora paradoxa]|uniref:MYND-type domain-containing protein n=1 Tax=Schizopora paradoxa TaxID=27342 RepID=A0A0H2SBB7_9AGAM|nr:hypothetical protein SCHPADRAFT_85383 [Schizopora paradoxa]
MQRWMAVEGGRRGCRVSFLSRLHGEHATFDFSPRRRRPRVALCLVDEEKPSAGSSSSEIFAVNRLAMDPEQFKAEMIDFFQNQANYSNDFLRDPTAFLTTVKNAQNLDDVTRLSKIYTVTNTFARLPASAKPLAFDTLFYLLPEFWPGACPLENIQLVESVGLVFMAIYNERDTFPAQADALTPIIKRHWQRMLPWFTHYSYRRPIDYIYERALQTKQGMQAVFAGSAANFASIPALRDFMCMDPEFVRCIGRIWNEEDTDNENELGYCSRAMLLILANDSLRGRVVDAMAEAFKGGLQGLAGRALTHMSFSINSPVPHRINMSWRLSIVLLLATTPNQHPIQKILLDKEVVRLCSEAAVRVDKERDGRKYDHEVYECFATYLRCIRSLMNCPSGSQVAQEAIRSKHLEALICCSSITPYLTETQRKILEDQLSKHIPTYLVSKSTLEAALEGLSNLSTSRLEVAVGKTVAKDHWNAFLRLTFERATYLLYHKFLMRGRRGEIQICDTCFVSDDIPGHTFFRCTGCKRAVYCSKACQLKGWKENGHKEECKSITNKVKAGEEVFWARPNDAVFLQTIASLDFRRHIPGLKSLVASKFKETPFSSKKIGISADYSVYPPIFDAFILDDEIRDLSSGNPGMTSILDHVRSSRNKSENRFATRVRYQEGGKRKEWVFLSLDLGPISLDDSEMATSSLEPGVVVDVDGRRPGAVDVTGRSLATRYDEVDALYLPALMRAFCESIHPWQAVQRGLQVFCADDDWPFESDIFTDVN